jgi:hypothetical protein
MSKQARTRRPTKLQINRGQALIEYALILALAIIGLVAILMITAPVVGNVFSNTVYNLLGQTTTPQEPLSSNDFWNVVTAVASYTPADVDLVTNTPLPPTDENADPPTDIPPVNTYTPTPTFTFTPDGWISPTPEDEDFDFLNPFDGDDEDDWQDDDWLDLLDDAGPWDGEYWDRNGTSAGDCNSGNIFNFDNGTTAVAAKATNQVDKISFPNADNDDDYWQTSSDRPYPGVDADFCSRFETEVELTGGLYTWEHISDDQIRVYIIHQDNTVEKIFEDTSYSDSWNDNTPVEWANANPGLKTIRIVHVDTGGGARLSLRLTLGDLGTTDEDCDWQLDDERFRTEPDAWNDSPDSNYQNDQFCVLKLRGTIDLSGAGNPSIEFYDAYNINTYDEAIVGISIEGTGIWNDYVIHKVGTNYAFQRQLIDLTNFTGDEGTFDYTTYKIELRFVMASDTNWQRAGGWWIDDIKLHDDPDYKYTIGFQDDVETTEYWIPDGQWARTTEKSQSGSHSWTDYPNENYEQDTDTSLTLNGHLDLTVGEVNSPQVAFWHSWNLGSGDEIYVEISTNRQNWVALRTGPSDSDNWLERESTNNEFVFQALTIPEPYNIEDRLYVRFRLYSNNNSTVGSGWFIDDIEFRNKPTDSVTPGWCDFTEEGSGDWQPTGDWALTNTDSWYGLYSWTDSPGGDYTHGSNTWLELKPYIDLSGAGLTRPVIEFWNRWDMGVNKDTGDGFHVEVSTDDGDTWTELWMFDEDNGRLPGYGSSIYVGERRYSHNTVWTREIVELDSFLGSSELRLRFRLDARSDTDVGDGWYIDSVCVKDMLPPVVSVPFADDLEGGSDYWVPNGTWQLANDSPHSGNFTFTESPSGTEYDPYSSNILELEPVIDLDGTVLPTLYYWQRYEMNDRDKVAVLYRRTDENGKPLSNWEYLDESRTQFFEKTNRGWHRVAVDLSPGISWRYVQFRFQLEALRDDTTADGWRIDDLSIVDRYGNEMEYTADPWFEDVEALVPGEWVMGGTWDQVDDFRNFGSAGALGPGQWTVTAYNNVNNGCSASAEIDLTQETGTTTYDEIDYNWYSGRPGGLGLTSNDTWGLIYSRTLVFTEDSTFYFTGRVDDGMRIYDNGSLIFEYQWDTCGSSSFDRDHADNPYTFTEGTHNVEVHFYEQGGNARMHLYFNGETKVFHDSPDGDYEHKTNTWIELEGAVDLAGVTNPVLFWDERYDLGSGDYVKVEVSSDGGFNWDKLASRGGTNWDWTERWVDLSSRVGSKINIRVRLDALNNEAIGDGYWIDNIRIIE